MKIEGTITALITPFIDQELDEEGLAENIKYQIEQGINGILALGSTGETATLSPEEQQRVISIAVGVASGKVPIWVGTGTNCTRQTIEKTKQAKDLGADIALVVTPYYNKPTQEGIFRHFEAITRSVDIPIVIYNVQSRCGVNIDTSTLKRIAALPHILGVKEASGSISQVGDVMHTIVNEHPDFMLFCGDDILTLPMMALGAVGVVSVASNLIPAKIVAQVNAASQGQFELARSIHYELLPFYKSLFIETNPIPIKTAMHLCGRPSGECRLPLTQMTPQNINMLRRLLPNTQTVELK